MPPTIVIDAEPWGGVLLALALLLPRLAVRVQHPGALLTLPPRRVRLSYVLSALAAIFMEWLFELSGMPAWGASIPIASLREYSHVSASVRYIAPALWVGFVAAFSVVPIAAWLNAKGRAYAVLLLLFSSLIGLFDGALFSLLWSQPLNMLLISMGSAALSFGVAALAVATALGYPFRVRSASTNAT